jgi:hypothetical protein
MQNKLLVKDLQEEIPIVLLLYSEEKIEVHATCL